MRLNTEKVGQMHTKINKKDLKYLSLIVCDDGRRIIKVIQKSRRPINKLIQKYSSYITDYVDFVLRNDWEYSIKNRYLRFNFWISYKKYNELYKIINRYWESDNFIEFSEKEIDEIINVTAFMIDRLKAVDTFFKKIDYEYK